MQYETMLPKYVDALITGNRMAARDIVRKGISTGAKAHAIYKNILFPAMERVENFYREDIISKLTRNMATRINRFLTDQIQSQLLPKPANGKTVVVMCADAEAEELGGQMCADLLESEGWQSFFLGGSVPDDEVTEFIGTTKPDLLVIYGSTSSGVPTTRQMIHRIRDIGLCPLMNVLVTGGIFNRVEGLWEELQADLFASDPVHLLDIAQNSNRKFHYSQETAGPKRRRRLVAGPINVN